MKTGQEKDNHRNFRGKSDIPQDVGYPGDIDDTPDIDFNVDFYVLA